MSDRTAGLKEWIGLAVLSLPALLVSVDLSVMILDLPHIGLLGEPGWGSRGGKGITRIDRFGTTSWRTGSF